MPNPLNQMLILTNKLKVSSFFPNVDRVSVLPAALFKMKPIEGAVSLCFPKNAKLDMSNAKLNVTTNGTKSSLFQLCKKYV